MKFGVDVSDLRRTMRGLDESSRKTKPALAKSINEVGDGLVSIVASNLARDTGLALEQVRGLMRVKRATRNDLSYDVIVNNRLLEDDPITLEGRRESSDFGKRQPRALVIIVNQKDDLVCMDCEELQAAGPMPIEAAREHIPKHPNCRCIILPYVAKGKRLPVTMTSLTGTDPARRSGGRQNKEMTLRQMAQSILDNTKTNIRISLK